MVRHSSRDSAVYRESFGEEASFSTTDHILANLYDVASLMLWLQTKDGQKGRNRPKPMFRPGKASEVRELSELDSGALHEAGQFSAGNTETSMTIEDFDRLMAGMTGSEPN
jgi:hypothetical protein